MTQDEKWMIRYNEVKTFIETNHRNPSKYTPEEKLMTHFLKRGRKLMNAGELKERLKDATDDIEQQVHVSSGYQVLVSQKVIDANKKTFREFVEELETIVLEKIGGN